MGWADCGNDSKGRPIGYGFSGTCDHPGCNEEIDRGLGCACGGMHGEDTLGGERSFDWSASFPSCEGYFCEKHRISLTLEHVDGEEAMSYSPDYCWTCAAEHDRLYREDENFRDLWPTDEPPLASLAAEMLAEEKHKGGKE